MKIMRDLFEKQLQHLYNSEILILQALPEMFNYVTDEKLEDIIKTYTKETYDQKKRVEQIGEYLKMKIAVDDGKMIKGLLGEINELYTEFEKGLIMDVGLVSKLQHVEHFQISAYETALLYAKNLGLDEVAGLLQQTLDEAYEADEYCSHYAKSLLL